MRDMRNAFGRAPEDFKYSVAGVLSEIKKKENSQRAPIRKSILVLAAAMVLLVAGVVYAVVSEYRVSNFYKDTYQVELQPELQEQMVAEAPVDNIPVGPLAFRVQEVYLQDDKLYASANASTEDGTPAYFMATDVGPSDNVSSFFQENRGSDDRTYLEAAREDGRRLFYVSFSAGVPDFDGGGAMLEYVLLPDGSASFVSIADVEGIPEGREKVMVEYRLVVREVDTATGEYSSEDGFRHNFQEEVSVHRGEVGEGFPVDKVFAGSAVRLDEIAFQEGMVGIDCIMYCSRVEAGEGVWFATDPDYYLTLVDETGEYLPNGPGSDSNEGLPDGRWRITRSMNWNQVPSSGETLYIRLYDIMTKDTVDIIEVQVP